MNKPFYGATAEEWWNWAGREGQPIDVWCHTNVERVELFLNGTSLGVKEVPRNTHIEWQVPYAPGTIEARGYRETTGAPSRVALRVRPRLTG